jgi:hypothetical protein
MKRPVQFTSYKFRDSSIRPILLITYILLPFTEINLAEESYYRLMYSTFSDNRFDSTSVINGYSFICK